MYQDFEPLIIHPNPGEEVWVQSLQTGNYEVGVQLNQDQYTFLELSRAQLMQFRANIDTALTEQ